jgi:hypothetical protein
VLSLAIGLAAALLLASLAITALIAAIAVAAQATRAARLKPATVLKHEYHMMESS